MGRALTLSYRPEMKKPSEEGWGVGVFGAATAIGAITTAWLYDAYSVRACQPFMMYGHPLAMRPLCRLAFPAPLSPRSVCVPAPRPVLEYLPGRCYSIIPCAEPRRFCGPESNRLLWPVMR